MNPSGLGRGLTQYVRSNGRIRANSSNVLQLADKCGGYAELAAGTYTLPTLEAGQSFFYFFVGATGAVTITGVGSITSNSVAMIAQQPNGAWAVTPMGSSLSTGFIPLPLESFRLIASNDIAAKNAADGGIISVDTAPKFIRVNAATDKALRIQWEAGSSVEITQGFYYPPDLDDTQDVTVKLRTIRAGGSDTVNIAVGYFEGVGDSNAGGNTADLDDAVLETLSVTIAAANVGAVPNFASVSLTPGTHATDVIRMYAAWIEYTKI